MKRLLLIIFSLFVAQCAFGYETVLVDFPVGQGWHSAFYGSQGDETILQYVPAGQTSAFWNKTVIFHSYKNPKIDDAKKFLNKTTSEMELKNSSQMYKYLKFDENDSIATRCITKNKYTPTQCEILRVTNSYEGIITMHYINKNVQNFKNTYLSWLQIMRNIRVYYSYYMDDRILDKATIFQL